MNIVHLSVNGPYTDGWGYQDNIIPKYHKKFGHNVTVIANNTKHSEIDGKIVNTNTGDYILPDGVRIIRVKKKKFINQRYTEAYVNYDVFAILCELKPDFIMVHGICSISALQVAKYVRRINKDCIVVADTHQDYYNSKTSGGIKFRLYKYYLILMNNYMQKYYNKVYGITPDCIKLAQEFFKINNDKLELLPLGFDVDLVDFDEKNNIRTKIRDFYNISNEDLLIVTGGKLDQNKNTHLLMNVVANIEKENIKLIVFGNVMTEEYSRLLTNIEKKFPEKIKCIGFLSNEEIYNLYLAADVAIFPGTQSALWQQAIATGLALIVKKWPNVDYLDLGGNIKFLDIADENEIMKEILKIMDDKELLNKMKEVAIEKGRDFFSYEKISKRVLEIK